MMLYILHFMAKLHCKSAGLEICWGAGIKDVRHKHQATEITFLKIILALERWPLMMAKHEF